MPAGLRVDVVHTPRRLFLGQLADHQTGMLRDVDLGGVGAQRGVAGGSPHVGQQVLSHGHVHLLAVLLAPLLDQFRQAPSGLLRWPGFQGGLLGQSDLLSRSWGVSVAFGELGFQPFQGRRNVGSS